MLLAAWQILQVVVGGHSAAGCPPKQSGTQARRSAAQCSAKAAACVVCVTMRGLRAQGRPLSERRAGHMTAAAPAPAAAGRQAGKQCRRHHSLISTLLSTRARLGIRVSTAAAKPLSPAWGSPNVMRDKTLLQYGGWLGRRVGRRSGGRAEPPHKRRRQGRTSRGWRQRLAAAGSMRGGECACTHSWHALLAVLWAAPATHALPSS